MKKIVSIFSGIDCLGIGFRNYFDLILAVEKEVNACKSILANKENFHPHINVVNKDIFSISDSFISQYKGADGLIGGPPCQPYSPAKSKFDPNDTRIQGLTEYVRWVRLIEPSFFMFENTEGLTHKSKKPILDHLIDELKNLGYDVFFNVLNAHDYGSVQNRKRVILVGFKKELKVHYSFPKPISTKKLVKDILVENEPLGECLFYPPKRKEIISFVPEGGNWKNLPSEDLIKLALGGNYEKREGGMTGVYKRLDRNSYCPTLTTNPLQRNTMAAHPIENRPLSVLESKRAQGIPENYHIIGSIAEKYKFIGNGVPVELAEKIAQSIDLALLGNNSPKTHDIAKQIEIEKVQYFNVNKSNQLSLF